MADSWGWAGNVGGFLSTSIERLTDALSAHHSQLLNQRPSGSQLRAWKDELNALQVALKSCVTAESDRARTWSVVLEYELPLEGGRRPDAVVLAGSTVVVIEFKGGARPAAADADQVRAYARDLADYHADTHGRPVRSLLVYTGLAPAAASLFEDVPVVGPDAIAHYLDEFEEQGDIDLEPWLRAPYRPLPSLVEAAKRIFRHEPLPHVTTALSAGIPETVDYLGTLIDDASRAAGRVLAFVTGVPGAGKTLVGLRLVYERSRADERATFLSGNGPLVKVLQDALRSGVFVRDLHAFINTYGLNDARIPDERVIVFDEAQRAWDRDYMSLKRGIDASEPDLLVRVGDRLPGWAALVGLVGEGQEIHSGEEGGIEQWRDAVVPATNNWVVHCPAKLATTFEGLTVKTDDRLDLTVSLRSRRADQLHHWVALLLEGSLAIAARQAMKIHGDRFELYLTRDLDEAKAYVRSRYETDPSATYGLVASSHAKVLPKHGVDNTFMATTKVMNYGKWFNGELGDAKACTSLNLPVTEFGCQGLELDFPIVCWGEDYRWAANTWNATPIRRRVPQHDPIQLLKNSYRVLLTRGRDGLVIFVPPDPRLDETETALLAAGVRPMPDLVALMAHG